MSVSGKWGKERRQLRIPGKVLTRPAAVETIAMAQTGFQSIHIQRGPRAVHPGLKDLLYLPGDTQKARLVRNLYTSRLAAQEPQGHVLP